MQAQFIINDGQHRRAAIERALKEEPDIGDETIAVVFFVDRGLERCQQMFADLNRYAIRPSKSLGLLYDHRDEKSQLAKLVVLQSKTFNNLVEMEKTNLSARSRKLFTLSSIYSANTALLDGHDPEGIEEAAEICTEYWDTVGRMVPEWNFVRESKMTSGDVRRDFIHSHAIVLLALGHIGNELINKKNRSWKKELEPLSTMNWSRTDARSWEGRALIGGRVSKSNINVTLTTNLIKQHLGLSLTPEQNRIEKAFLRGDYEQ